MFRLVRVASRDISLCTVDSSTTKAKIGRDPKTCIVQLGTKAVAVSREHADLLWSTDGVTLVDTSSFGTFVDGVKILKSSKLLKGGERLKIGVEEFILEKIEEVKVPQNTESSRNKPATKNSIASYFTKKNDVLREQSQPAAEVSIRKILATETPSESQESQKVPSQGQSKPVRGGRKRVNPLFHFDDDEDDGILNNVGGKVLAADTPSDSVPSPQVAAPIAPIAPQPTNVPLSTANQANTTTAKKKKVSLFAKPSHRARTTKPIVFEDNDDMVELDTSLPPSNTGRTSPIDDGFVRPSVPRSTRSRTTLNQGMAGPSSRIGTANGMDRSNISSADMNAASIATQVIPQVRASSPMGLSDLLAAEGFVSQQPPRKKKKSFFEEHFKKQRRIENSKPKEKSLLDEDDNGVLNIRYDYVAPKPVFEERAYSCMENVRIMDQAAREAKARLDAKYRINDSESQYHTAEELASLLCSSHTEKKRNEADEEKEDEEVDRVGDETLDEEIKSQMVKFCDSLVVSQPLNDSMASVIPSQGKGFKKFKKAKQGRFASQSAVFSEIIGGSDLVDFRKIHL